MNTKIFLICCLFAFLTVGAGAMLVLARTSTVTRIIDGDTIEVAGVERVRLIGINAPELGDAQLHKFN